MAIDQSRRKSMFGRLGPIAAVLVLLLSGTLTGFDSAHAQDQDRSGTAGLNPSFGTLRITSRDRATGAIIKGACYIARTGLTIYTFGCDASDPQGLDGITTMPAVAGRVRVSTHNPPSHYYFAPPTTGFNLAESQTKNLTIKHDAGASDVIVRAYSPTGVLVRGGCYQAFVNNNGTPGDPKSNVVCDFDNGAYDGVIRLSGFSPSRDPSLMMVMVNAPPGLALASPKAFRQTVGSDSRVNFHPALISLTPSCTAGPTSGPVGTNVTISCRGFAMFQVVAVRWEGRTSKQVLMFTNQNGQANTIIGVPPAIAGIHRIVIVSDTHKAPTKQFTVIPSVSVSPDRGIGGSTAKATLRGFGKGESVNIRIQGSRRILATVVVSSTGSGSVSFSILNGAAADLVVVAEGNAGHVAKDGFRRTGPAPTPTPTQTATATPTGTPTATSTATASPSATSTSTATATATNTATATSTDTATPTATSTETVIAPPAEVIPATPTG